MKKIELLGMGNGIVDALVEVQDSFLAENNLKKGSMTLVDKDQQSRLFDAIASDYLKIACGGSVCNSVFTFASLGGSAAMLTSIGQDNFANFYLDQLNLHQIAYVDLASQSSEPTGTSLVLISPDGERTMCTCLGASADFSTQHLSSELIADAKFLFIEGYLLASDSGWEAVLQAIEIAKKYDTKIILTLSAEFIVTVFRNRVEQILPKVDLLFANENESAAFTGKDSPLESGLELVKIVPEVVITAGAFGSYYFSGDNTISVPAISCQPVDLTGAGDSFAAGFILGQVKGLNSQKSLELGSYLAYRIITQIGARVDDLSLDELRNKSYL